MGEVITKKATQKLHIQLGIPLFVLVGFSIGVLIFGTLYFGVSGGGDGKPPKDIAHAASVFISDNLVKQIQDLESVEQMPEALMFDSTIETSLRNVLSSHKSILAISYFNSEGGELFELHKSRINEDVLRTALNGPIHLGLVKEKLTSYFTLSTNTAVPIIYYITPLNDDKDIFLGFMVVVIDGERINSSLNALVRDTPSKIEILDKRTANTLLFYNSLPSLQSSDGFEQEKLVALFGADKREFGYETEEGVIIYAAWEGVKETNWNVVAHTPRGNFAGKNKTIFIFGTLAIVILIVITLIFVSIFNNKLLRPLRQIEKIISHYKVGDYTEEVKVGTKNEFAEIALLLNTMAHNVEKGTSERLTELKKTVDRQSTDTKLLIEKDVELREKSQKLKELDSAKSMFVSVAAHQMRTPLSAVKWAIKLVLDGDVGPINEEQKKYLTMGHQSAKRMISLINDLLDIDKIESDKFVYEFIPENIVDILKSIINELSAEAKEKGVHITFEDNIGTAVNVDVDKVKITNALQNLIDNAIKYTIGGGDVTIKTDLEKETVKISIADTGIGIPLEDQGQVFGKFFRAKNAIRQQTDGSGLGLFIVKKIIEKHSGSISFESQEKRGTTFFITLPTTKA